MGFFHFFEDFQQLCSVDVFLHITLSHWVMCLFQVCLGWTNSILWEAGITLQSLDDLRCGVALVTVVDILWPEAQLSEQLLEAEKVC